MAGDNPKSEALFATAGKHFVGGVNSPVRAFGAVGGTPRFIASAKGALLEDVDGNKYIDFVGSWGPMILGHNPAAVLKAVRAAVAKGTSFGACSPGEVQLAELVREAFPSVEKLRFTTSGTEATMTAIRLARAWTNRVRIAKFEGGYHGHSDSLLVAAGSGATTFGVPSSAGVPDVLAKNTWVLPYNDVEALENLFLKQGPNIAAVIVEPVCGNMGVVTPEPAFLNALVQTAKKYGALLIFDEVMTGFRLASGGAQELFRVTPDLTCLGKIIGGGFPVGAVGGKKEIMDLLAPTGAVYQAGTLAGNPVAMAAGIATLKALRNEKPYAALDKATAHLAQALRASAQKHGVPVQVNQIGSMFTVFFTASKVSSYFQATQSNTKRYGTFFHALLDRGVYMPPSQFEAAFVSTAHTPAVMEKAREAFDAAFGAVAATMGKK
jgi:glutamate-1-semialdehyde 2,1-aminomutase